jgi:D-glycero-D-manno-heptose 1,7-bisphosphate phosphatase
LRERGFLLIVVTNQPDVARGTQTREAVALMNAAIQRALPVDGFFVCWHDDADRCPCRKPKPGLLIEAAATLSLDLHSSFLVGDRWRDIEAGAAAGCRTVLIDWGYREKPPQCPPDFSATSLTAAVDWILEQP